MDADNQLAIIRPEVGCTSFEADGVTYTRTDSLVLKRSAMLQRYQTELQFNMHIPTVQKELVQLKEHMQKVRFVDAALIVDRLMAGSDLLGQNRFREMEIVGLFYNAPNEDFTEWSYEGIVKPKMHAWRAVDGDFFTLQAFTLLARTSTHYPLPQNLNFGLAPTESPSPTDAP
jgi:hypothetical protein